ncbi:hypothetical protein V1478_004498 [Vespula squamosa]|uniref:Uncharacterized protein n=1 Tax=Vespula squamosa TaxID=30214 RepID=A0ABD2BGC9_VESSQ
MNKKKYEESFGEKDNIEYVGCREQYSSTTRNVMQAKEINVFLLLPKDLFFNLDYDSLNHGSSLTTWTK